MPTEKEPMVAAASEASGREVAAIANVEAAASWDGTEGDHWTEFEEHYDAASAGYDPRLYSAAQLSATDRVLDIGWGVSTLGAARIATSGAALGVDLSARMYDLADDVLRRHVEFSDCSRAHNLRPPMDPRAGATRYLEPGHGSGVRSEGGTLWTTDSTLLVRRNRAQF